MEIFTIETDDVNKRVDVFLNEEMEDISRSALQKNIEKGNITVNGEKISKNYKLRIGDIVEAELLLQRILILCQRIFLLT